MLRTLSHVDIRWVGLALGSVYLPTTGSNIVARFSASSHGVKLLLVVLAGSSS